MLIETEPPRFENETHAFLKYYFCTSVEGILIYCELNARTIWLHVLNKDLLVYVTIVVLESFST